VNQQALAAVPSHVDQDGTAQDGTAQDKAALSAPTPAVTLESLAAEVAALRARVEQLEARGGEPMPTLASGAVEALPGEAPAAPTDRAPAPVLGARPHDPHAEIHALLQVMFTLALNADPEDPSPERVERDFEQFRALVHSSRKGSPLLNQELFHYKWKPLCKRVKGYLSNHADPNTFQVTSTQPDRIDARTESVRVFVRADKRMPPPVLLRRDPDAGQAFRIDQSSL
jgi:hypothetical protein